MWPESPVQGRRNDVQAPDCSTATLGLEWGCETPWAGGFHLGCDAEGACLPMSMYIPSN